MKKRKRNSIHSQEENQLNKKKYIHKDLKKEQDKNRIIKISQKLKETQVRKKQSLSYIKVAININLTIYHLSIIIKVKFKNKTNLYKI